MVRFLRWALLLVGVLFMGSCFSLSGLSAFPCAKDGTCPDTYYCNASNECATCCDSNGNNCQDTCISTNDGSAGCDPANQSACSGGCFITGPSCVMQQGEDVQTMTYGPQCECANGGAWATTCGGAGTGEQGGACPCAPGFLCANDCYTQCGQLCDLLHPDLGRLPSCPSGTVCSGLAGVRPPGSSEVYNFSLEGPVINGIFYGVCAAPIASTGGTGGA